MLNQLIRKVSISLSSKIINKLNQRKMMAYYLKLSPYRYFAVDNRYQMKQVR